MNEWNSKWVRRFSVDDVSKHQDGFTIYKITSILFPIDAPESVTIVSVWKRYSDIQKLQKSIKALHSGLHLKGTVPSFKKWGYFKRFEPVVIEERMRGIKDLLEFIGEHNLLFTSSEFVLFLQDGYPDPYDDYEGSIASIRTSLQLPSETLQPIEYKAVPETRAQDVTDAQRHHEQQRYCVQQPSDIVVCEPFDIEIKTTPKHKETDDPSNSESFDSLSTLNSSGSLPYDEIMSIQIQTQGKHVLPDLINFDKTEPSTSRVFEDYHTHRGADSDVKRDCNPASVVTSNRDDSDTSETVSLSSNRISTRSDSKISVSSCNLRAVDTTCDSYVFEAGYLLNNGARAEDNGNFKKAFECYKAGIEKMLIGVQNDPDAKRQAAIKEKIQKYLSHAETLYREHIDQIDNTYQSEWCTYYKTKSPPVVLLSNLYRSYNELSRYRVIDILYGQVMLVIDTTQQTRNKYAMKVIQKIPQNLTEFDNIFPHQLSDVKRPILPTNVPYMVQLKAYIETPNLVFLLLDYVPGGRLIDYINKYAQSNPSTPIKSNINEIFLEPKSKQTAQVEILSVPVRKSESQVRCLSTRVVTERCRDNSSVTSVSSSERSVNDLVVSAQQLLKNVDTVLMGGVESGTVDVESPGECRDTTGDGLLVIDVDGTVVEHAVDVGTHQTIKSPKRCIRNVLPACAISKWAAELLLAIENLHASGVVCRVLGIENILLGDDGHLVLTYFVGYEGIDVTLDIVKRYLASEARVELAPELLRNVAPTDEVGGAVARACDMWCYGIVLYHLICGVPFRHYHRYPVTGHTIIKFPDGIHYEVKSLLNQLLTYDPNERLGSKGIDEVKKHPYFKNIDWKVIADAWTPGGV